jgi:pSer/pThr/pTyr-binding forkhead associated (FHA) protein
MKRQRIYYRKIIIFLRRYNMSRPRNRSLLSWIFLQDPTPKDEQKAAQIQKVQSPVNMPPYFQKAQRAQSLSTIRLFIKSEEMEDYITVNTFPSTIGRVDDGETDIVIKDRSISKSHASIIYRDNVFYVIDNGSKNGIRIMGQILNPGAVTPINQGDILKLGRVEVHICDVFVEPEYKDNQTGSVFYNENQFSNENQSMHLTHNLHQSPVAPYAATSASIPVQSPPEHISNVSKFCAGCGRENIQMRNFCGSCGKNLQI